MLESIIKHTYLGGCPKSLLLEGKEIIESSDHCISFRRLKSIDKSNELERK